MSLKLHLFGYHEWYGGLGLDGGINPNCGFHCRKCRKSWLPARRWDGIALSEIFGHAFHINYASNRTGWVFIGRMTMKEFLKQLNKPE